MWILGLKGLKYFTFHLQYKHSGTFANRKYEELSYPQNPKMYEPIVVRVLKMQAHYSKSSCENVTPSSGTSLLARYKDVPFPFRAFGVVQSFVIVSYFVEYTTGTR